MERCLTVVSVKAQKWRPIQDLPEFQALKATHRPTINITTGFVVILGLIMPKDKGGMVVKIKSADKSLS